MIIGLILSVIGIALESATFVGIGNFFYGIACGIAINSLLKSKRAGK
jgi:predicted benzoate:H+ symporter BenE